MKVRSDIKKSVTFIGLQMADLSFKFVGTGLFFGDQTQRQRHTYLATAKHVIEGIRSKGLDAVHVRVNLANGQAKLLSTQIDTWIYHDDPNVDLAIRSCGIPRDWDHVFFPLGDAMTQNVIEKYQLDVGEETFIVGLFKHHHGTSKNIPIVRVGNIAAVPEEPVQTRDFLMDAYLIECRSIGGLSGSPVFVNLGGVRMVNGELHCSEDGTYFLMGLIHGHYDSKATEIDIEESIAKEKVNTGIAIVTPIDKLISLFNSPRTLEIEKHLRAAVGKAGSLRKDG